VRAKKDAATQGFLGRGAPTTGAATPPGPPTGDAAPAGADAAVANAFARCPLCREPLDVNAQYSFRTCCCRYTCTRCADAIKDACPLCDATLPGSTAEILAMLRKHVAARNPAAIRQLGVCYAHGRLGLASSHKKASQLYAKAVNLGDAFAVNYLAFELMRGRGTKMDRKKAVSLYRRGADHPATAGRADTALGDAYYHGYGVARDLDGACRHYMRAARAGVGAAEFMLSIMYAKGEGVARADNVASSHYLNRAARHRDPNAIRIIEDLVRQKTAAEKAKAEALPAV